MTLDQGTEAGPVRHPAVAGMFYEDQPARLRRDVRGFLDRAAGAVSEPAPKAIIAPHAGYPYSGPVAGSAYAAVKALRRRIRRVVLLGPAHRVYFRGLAASSAQAFATPLGSVPVEQDALRALCTEAGAPACYSDQAHAMEHSLEVQLPFLQEILDEFSILPFAVGDADPSDVASLIERLWGGAETLIVVSSDLSHYRGYQAAREIDSITMRKIQELDDAGLTGEHACGYLPISGLLRVALRRGLRCEVLDMRSSGDTAGPRDRVVGYGAFAFYPQ
ncbi:MAG TPA: AmmeMemoRadiSam system protein B [Arenicellales bacterium]|nr:AmmeMemoRadiSam system protein B [Arenicellales bacterium]